ncbi:MAG: peptidylprolyl isomerase [Chthonomonadales bacterium]|nr:peptidylprolyl isomerase [Chthonomonadales bacterium]
MRLWVRTAATLAALCLVGAALAVPKAPPAPKVEITVAHRGKVTIALFPKDAPKTVAHFLGLVRKGFYDGIVVHRVEPGFVVQAGDPQTKTRPFTDPAIGSGGSGRNIPFERSAKPHEIGTVAMALSAPRSATGDSQWFINLAPNHQLDGDYCVFGKVTKGMDVVRKIKPGDRIVRARVLRK